MTVAMQWAGMDAQPITDPDAMDLPKLNSFLYGIQEQPTWRARADIEADYYDSNQLNSQALRLMADRGIPPIVVNLIAPTIDMVLGLEVKTRSDTICRPESEKDTDIAMAMTNKMKEVERLSGADRATADAFAAQIKVGLGWVETNWNYGNPFRYPLRESYVHRREIWWDWMDDDPMLTQARFLTRRKWYDEDVAIGYFPQFADLIKNAVRQWADWDPTQFETAPPYFMDNRCERDFAWADEEWRDTQRKKVCLYEVWYRTVKRGLIIRSNEGRVIEFNRGNPLHQAAVTQGIGQLQEALIPKMRQAWWMGPYRMVDIPSPLPHQDFPYTPFWGYREDRTGVPYGMIRRMLPLQDEVNARRARMLWQLSARRVIGDEDVVTDWDKMLREVARPDAAIKLNKNRVNKRGELRVEDNQSLTAQQMEVYLDSKKTLQDSAGVFLEQLGKAGAADSGIAISQLIEQGTTTLAEINDNHKFGRIGVATKRLAHVKVMLADKRNVVVNIERLGKRKKVKLNVPRVDADTGVAYLDNDVTLLQTHMALDDVPATPTARMEQFRQLTDLVKGLPENLQAAVITIVVKASDIPQKEEMIQALKNALGIQDSDPENMTPEEQEQMKQAMADQEKVKAMNDALMEAEVQLKEMQGKLASANAALSKAKTAQILVESNIKPELANADHETPVEEEPISDTPGERMIAAQDKRSLEDADTGVPGGDPMRIKQLRMSEGLDDDDAGGDASAPPALADAPA